MANRITDSRYQEAMKIVEAYEAQEKAKDKMRQRLDAKKRQRARVRAQKAKKEQKPKQPTLAECGGDINKWLEACDKLCGGDGGYVHRNIVDFDRFTLGAQEGVCR
jgi:uncharacterized FlaG/YvyC family protein